MLIIFFVGYLAIVMEQQLRINKAAIALVTGVLCWLAYLLAGPDTAIVNFHLAGQFSETAGILFFLLGAMTIVELIDAHDGFDLITRLLRTPDKRKLLILIALISFFLSAFLDNLTTTIVMVSLCRKLLLDPQDRLYFAGMIVIAANAGGAWSPIGDVTTTMLWIGGQVSAAAVIKNLFLPSLVSTLLPLFFIARCLKKEPLVIAQPLPNTRTERTERNLIFFTGLLALVCVPVFKMLTHLPPFTGMLLALGMVWLITELIHRKKAPAEKDNLSVNKALQRIDSPSILFFLGILLAVGALQSSGLLAGFSQWLSARIQSPGQLGISFGVLSAIIDNVPLVAAAKGMYSLTQYPTDSFFWQLLAYCTGTGGSLLVIGSAAGVAAMGIENISFGWYLKRISFWALLGYLSGAAFFLLQNTL